MAYPNFLNWEFDVNMRFTVTQDSKFRIYSFSPDVHAGAILNMEPDLIFAPQSFDAYVIGFDLKTWLRDLRWILQETDSSLSIRKSLGSMDIFCSLGGTNIRLGEAKYFNASGLSLNFLGRNVRVTMEVHAFIELIDSIITRHDHGVSAVQILITQVSISWNTPAGPYHHPTEGFVIEGLTPGTSYQINLRWALPVFEMLSSALFSWSRVELSSSFSLRGDKVYRFRFLRNDASHEFCYFEKEP